MCACLSVLTDAGVKNFIYKNGQRVEATSALADGAKHRIPDYNAQMQRHHQLLRRQHFMDRK